MKQIIIHIVFLGLLCGINDMGAWGLRRKKTVFDLLKKKKFKWSSNYDKNFKHIIESINFPMKKVIDDNTTYFVGDKGHGNVRIVEIPYKNKFLRLYTEDKGLCIDISSISLADQTDEKFITEKILKASLNNVLATYTIDFNIINKKTKKYGDIFVYTLQATSQNSETGQLVSWTASFTIDGLQYMNREYKPGITKVIITERPQTNVL